MKLSKEQQLFIDTMLETLDTQFIDTNERLEELYKTYNADLKKFEEKVASIIYNYDVQGEVLNLTPKQKQQIKAELKQELGDTFKEQYYQEKDFIKSQLTEKGKMLYDYKSFLLSVGADFDMLPLPLPQLRKIVNAEVNSKIWSERLWDNKKDIEARLQKNFQSLINGRTDINKIKGDIRQVFNSNRYNTDRLVRNELTRVQSEINEVHDKKHGVEYQLYSSTLDKRTTSFCRQRDGNVYKIDDPNKPIPPLGTHISCRSCLVAIPNKDWKPSTRRDNETGEIIEYKTYKEWGKDKGKGYEVKETVKKSNKDNITKFNHGVKRDDVSPFIKRKSRSDFEDREDFSRYREQKKLQKEEYNKYIQKKIQEDRERPRNYLDRTKTETELKGLGVKAVNLEGIDPLFYDDIVESIKLNKKLYPNADIPFIGSEVNINDEYIKKHLFNDNVKYFMKENNISYDEALEYTKSVMSMDFNVDDALIEATHGMTFNSKYFSKYDYVTEMEYLNYLEGERALGNGNFMTTVTHEYGHRVAKLTNQSELVNEVMNKFPNQYVSEYATENNGEYFAEMYAEYVLNPNPTEHVKYFGELLNKALGGK